MTVKELVVEALRKNGFDGLCNPDQECGCPLDDLMPCDAVNERDCVGGFKIPCPHDSQGDTPYDFYISTVPPALKTEVSR
jgi:hypothetical protein